MNDVEKLAAFNSIRGYLDEETQNDILTKLGLDGANLPHRLRGLNIEAEFILILHLLECCKHILSFDEGTSVLSKSYSPDTLVVLNEDEEKIFIEIKSKDEFQYKISGGNLQKRIDFANEFGYKLYFAVKLKGYWGLYLSDYVQSKNGKLKIPDDYTNSEFEAVFKSNLLVFPKGIKVVSDYSETEEALVGIKHPNYGNLFSYKFYYNDSLIFEANKDNDESERKALISIFLEALHDTMSNQSQEIVDVGNGTTQIIEQLTENAIFYDYMFLLSHIYHTVSNLGSTFDSTTFYKSLLEAKGKSPIDKNILYRTIAELQSKGLPIIISTLKKENE